MATTFHLCRHTNLIWKYKNISKMFLSCITTHRIWMFIGQYLPKTVGTSHYHLNKNSLFCRHKIESIDPSSSLKAASFCEPYSSCDLYSEVATSPEAISSSVGAISWEVHSSFESYPGWQHLIWAKFYIQKKSNLIFQEDKRAYFVARLLKGMNTSPVE